MIKIKADVQRVLIAGIGDTLISEEVCSTLKTYALGSCVAVMAWDKKLKIGGMIHIALPDSKIDPEKAKARPGYFADTGIPDLIEKLEKLGAKKENLQVKIAGGAETMHFIKTMEIGKKNTEACRQIFKILNISIEAEDTLGKNARTIAFFINDGTCEIQSLDNKKNL